MKFRNLLMGAAIIALNATHSAALPLAFDNENGWKKDADGKIVTDDSGNPIYVNTAGQELSVGGDTIAGLNREAKTHREAKEKAEAQLAQYNGIDPAEARSALETVANLDSEQRVTAEDLKRIKQEARAEAEAEITNRFQSTIDEQNGTIGDLRGTIDTMTIDNAFNGSEFLRENIAVPSDMIRSTFGNNFKVEDGKMVAYDAAGNVIHSKKKLGENASFDEAMEIIIGNHPNKDQILRDTNEHSGTNSNGRGGNRTTGRKITRAEFDNLNPAKRSEAADAMRNGELTVV